MLITRENRSLYISNDQNDVYFVSGFRILIVNFNSLQDFN